VTSKGKQVVVMAGGFGSRLGEPGRQCPKVLQPVHGRPFLDFMLQPLLAQGFEEFCFCLGHLADQVVAHLRRQWGWLSLSFHVDAEPRGTAGSLRAARRLLDQTFLLVLGDTYLDMDYRSLLGDLAPDALGVMAVSEAPTEVPGNVKISGCTVTQYDKTLGAGATLVDAGAMALRKDALDLIAGTPHPVDLGELFRQMISRNALLAHTVSQPFYDIGTPDRLKLFADHVSKDLGHR
jgi:NDP-sugar pyrophosphorylase family protein